jgi:large subunit ribosomal protein L21
VYAVIRSGGRQYRVEEGRSLALGRLSGEPGDTVELGDVLLLADGDDVTVGVPTIAGARVLGTIASQERAPKIVVFRYKAKTRSRKKTGHRQHLTRVLIDEILPAGREPRPKPEKRAPAAEASAEAPKRRGRRTKETDSAPAAEPPPQSAPAAQTTPEEPVAEKKTRRSRKKTES